MVLHSQLKNWKEKVFAATPFPFESLRMALSIRETSHIAHMAAVVSARFFLVGLFHHGAAVVQAESHGQWARKDPPTSSDRNRE